LSYWKWAPKGVSPRLLTLYMRWRNRSWSAWDHRRTKQSDTEIASAKCGDWRVYRAAFVLMVSFIRCRGIRSRARRHRAHVIIVALSPRVRHNPHRNLTVSAATLQAGGLPPPFQLLCLIHITLGPPPRKQETRRPPRVDANRARPRPTRGVSQSARIVGGVAHVVERLLGIDKSVADCRK
jgi:hypothetical protein